MATLWLSGTLLYMTHQNIGAGLGEISRCSEQT